jgi:CBS domain-containing protein
VGTGGGAGPVTCSSRRTICWSADLLLRQVCSTVRLARGPDTPEGRRCEESYCRIDVVAFLRRYPPFAGLSDALLQRVAAEAKEVRFAEGATMLRRDDAPPRVLLVIRSGAVELQVDNVVLAVLREGECIGQFSLLAHEAPLATCVARQDTSCYVLPGEIASEVMESDAGRSYLYGMMRWVFGAAGDRLLADHPDARLQPLDTFVRRGPITISPDASIADAATKMTDEHVSSLLIPMRGGWGIVTDRELRAAAASRLSHDLPVEQIASFPVRTMGSSTSASDALIEMFTTNERHVPVTSADGEVIGVVTDTDLIGVGRHTPFALRSSIQRAKSSEEAVTAARAMPGAVLELVSSGAEPLAIGRIIALVVDALTAQLLYLGNEELGEPPAAWAWLALGSAARQEQSLRTDQDHALVWAGNVSREKADAYFSALAEKVVAGLEDFGIPRCTGNAMAINPEFRRPLAEAAGRFAVWIEEPSFAHSVASSVGFDFRQVAGQLESEPALNAAVRETRDNPGLARLLARRALDSRPPTGLLRDFVVERGGEHAGRLDIKQGGITIITNLGRAWGLRAGSPAKGTLARLDAAVEAGYLDVDVATELKQAFRFLWQVRLQNQTDEIRDGLEADDFIDPSAIGPLVRSGLKEAFRTIVRAQRLVSTTFRIEHR